EQHAEDRAHQRQQDGLTHPTETRHERLTKVRCSCRLTQDELQRVYVGGHRGEVGPRLLVNEVSPRISLYAVVQRVESARRLQAQLAFSARCKARTLKDNFLTRGG